MSWELPVLTTLIVSVLGLWWVYSPHSSYQKALYVLLCALTILVDPRRLAQHMYRAGYDAFLEFRLDVLLVHHFKMVLTLGAVVWLLHRSWQTLWKPVPDLINILGVDVPESPDVSLAGIRADAATLSWTRPTSNRPVQKYSIQVNGVHVGDSPGNEVAITVTGLKPNHFYNIRVVAVGQNNFQAGSEVVRLRTYGKDGKPQLGNSRLPASFTSNDQPRVKCDDDNGDPDTHKPSLPSVEAAPVLDGNAALAGDITSSIPGTRRNTINRRHSPSVASMDQPQIRPPLPDGPELSLDELNLKFEGIRKEINDTLSLYAKDEAEFQQQEEELKKEKERKRQALKEKEEQTTQLKGMVRTTMEQMRAVEKERAKKEQQLKDKETRKTKIRDSVAKLENEIERMKKERDGFQVQKSELEEKRDCSVLKLDESNTEVQEKCAELEKELKEKGKQLQDLKATRENFGGGEDEQRREDDMRAQREWAAKRDDLNTQLIAETRRTAQLDAYLNELGEQLLRQQSELAFYNQADASGLDFDPSEPSQDKRLSQNSGSLSNINLSPPPGQFPIPEGNFPATSALGRAGFGSGLFMDIPPDRSDEQQSESDMRAGGGPLSPTAHSLLPSGIFDEMFEGPESEIHHSSLLPAAISTDEDDPKSPASSGQSISILSSPHESSHNLPFPQYADGDEKSLELNSSPAPPPATGHRLASLLSTFQRSKPAKISEEGGPPIGTLRLGQSQSFPRGADEHDLANKRRMSFSWMKPHAEAEGARASTSSASKPFSARRLFPFASSAVAIPSDRDPTSSRPVSISSSDLPRPSTDSGSIWGTPGEFSALSKNRFWSPNDGRWPSRNGSRRPSIHGSPSALETTLASADDEILDDDDLLDPQTSPSQVGVIGSRPPGHRASISQRLNPTAPTFMATIFGTKDKARDGNSEKDKGKTKEKDRQRDKSREGKGKGKEATTPLIEVLHSLDDSPSDSRVSRDTFSVHTQTSVSESHESLNLLDTTASNSTSDMNAPSHKDAENVVKKLFRKGSSSKFSLSSRLGKDSSLFKKGPGSATYSDKNMSAEHRSSIGDFDDLGEDVSQLGRSYDSVTSSPSLGPSSSRGKEPKEGRMSNWRFSIKKKGKEAHAKEKESLDIDRTADDE
ncbi:Fc.00g019050.m01.CDS01 [Cosmosporella sp. VM-42]